MKQPIFLLGAHKSGTSLLRSLFDGHQDLFVIPKEIHLFETSGYWVDYYLRRKQPRNMTHSEVIDEFVEMLKKYNVTANFQADSVTLERWNITDFKRSIKSADLSNPKALFTATFQAMHQSLYGTPLVPQKRIVEKSVENAEFALDLHHAFPDAHFIHIIRNPYANLVSLRKFKSNNHYPFLKGLIFSLYNSYYHMWRNTRLLKNYHIIRYEDLVTKPKKLMKSLAELIDIPFHKCLLQPTQEGDNWVGNSVYSEPQSGISTASLTRWENEIYHFEINLINKTLPPKLFKEYDYEILKGGEASIKPMKGENIKIFIANRLLPYYL